MELSKKDTDATQDLSEEILQLVSFNLGKEEFAVDILKVHEIIRMVEITRVPKAPSFVEGVINLRGNVIPIIDLQKRFNLAEVEATKEARIIVVEISENTIGLIVDSVSEVLRLPQKTIEPAPSVTTSIESEYIHGVGKLDKRLLIMLDLDKILTPMEKGALNNSI